MPIIMYTNTAVKRTSVDFDSNYIHLWHINNHYTYNYDPLSQLAVKVCKYTYIVQNTDLYTMIYIQSS